MKHSLTLCVTSPIGTYSCGQADVHHLSQPEAMAAALETILEPAWPMRQTEQDWYALHVLADADWPTEFNA